MNHVCDAWMEGWLDGWTDGRTDGQVDVRVRTVTWVGVHMYVF